jgi:putative membrane protein
MMTGLGLAFGGFWMILVWLVIIGGGIWLLTALFPRQQSGGASSTEAAGENALAILKQRYARGELSRDEFDAMRHDLEQA